MVENSAEAILACYLRDQRIFASRIENGQHEWSLGAPAEFEQHQFGDQLCKIGIGKTDDSLQLPSLIK